jgi:hypothetical protein
MSWLGTKIREHFPDLVFIIEMWAMWAPVVPPLAASTWFLLRLNRYSVPQLRFRFNLIHAIWGFSFAHFIVWSQWLTGGVPRSLELFAIPHGEWTDVVLWIWSVMPILICVVVSLGLLARQRRFNLVELRYAFVIVHVTWFFGSLLQWLR